ncbi:MAG TPA: GNAT family N-acetyltransferase [bacterium]|nr:GNAT family N-acetyltransferase [bacterium]HMW32667.1 GNAT family N-acetyltransferase [bacterium]HMW35846.1 GNAT family N-acetyltransferase [bacterium]HMZ02967.1 GNAT family N-acetyltransferase [bacterium]HNB08223.1 GNAT family N-acetyltransferase [bacterium]
MDISVRRATIADATALALLARVTFEDAFGYVWTDKPVLKEYLDTTFSVPKITSSLSKTNNSFWIALADGLPVGYAKMKKVSPYKLLEDNKPAQLQKIYMLRNFIGQRIGERLQSALFDEVRMLGIRTLWLAVWDGNDKAIRFYERHGFQKTTRYAYDFHSMHFEYEVMTKRFDV